MSKRVLITGVSRFPGAELARALSTSKDVSYVAGVDLQEPDIDLGTTEFVRADIRSPLIHRVITSTEVDTVVHADLTSRPVRIGGRSAQKEWNVIGTMQLLGACQRIETVKKVIVRSSTAVYGNDYRDPSVLTEDWSSRTPDPHGYAKDLSDAETFARDFGRRRPEVLLTILRMANVVGPTAETNMTQLFSLPFVPKALGFDPRIQLLHEFDAIEVLRRAVVEDHPGVFNVAADGVMYLSQAIRVAQRLPLPIVTPLAAAFGDLFKRFGFVDFPTDQISLLVHGRVADNTRLKEVFGYEPRYSTVEALQGFLQSGRPTKGPDAFVEWEKEFYGLLDRIGAPPPTRPYVIEPQPVKE